jgi:hypothetical protein
VADSLTRRQIEDLQWLLSGHNRHRFKTYRGDVDGDAGPLTRRGTKEMWWKIGAPPGTARQPLTLERYRTLRSYLLPMRLTDAAELPEDWKKRLRRRARAGQPSAGYGGERIVRWARTQVGVAEAPPGSNTGTRVRWYQSHTWLGGTNWPWCAAFVCTAWIENGFPFPYRSAGAWDFVDGARKHGYHVSADALRPGDAVAYRQGQGHINLFLADAGGGRIETIGGNESNSVRHSSYDRDLIYGCARPPQLLQAAKGPDTRRAEIEIPREAFIATGENEDDYYEGPVREERARRMLEEDMEPEPAPEPDLPGGGREDEAEPEPDFEADDEEWAVEGG